jgi:hypothetical protein
MCIWKTGCIESFFPFLKVYECEKKTLDIFYSLCRKHTREVISMHFEDEDVWDSSDDSDDDWDDGDDW